MNTRPMDPGPPRPGPPPDQGRPGQVDPSQRMLTEIAQLRVKASGRDLSLLRLGAALMVLGPVLTVVGFLQSSQAANAMFQNDAIIIALIGVTTSIAGATLFLRYSFGEFLRFWMARILAEQHRQPVQPVMRRPPAEPGPGQGQGPGPGPSQSHAPGQGHAPPPPNGRPGAPAPPPGPPQRPSAPAPPPARPPWADRRPEQQP